MRGYENIVVVVKRVPEGIKVMHPKYSYITQNINVLTKFWQEVFLEHGFVTIPLRDDSGALPKIRKEYKRDSH